MGNNYPGLAIPAQQGILRSSKSESSRVRSLTSAQDEIALSESVFDSMLTLERQRAERSRVPFVLMLLDAHLENGAAAGILKRAVEVVAGVKRETDLVGWYREGSILGVIFTEIKIDPKHPVTETLRNKIQAALMKNLAPVKAAKIFFSLHVFPETWEQDEAARLSSGEQCPGFDRKA